MFHFTALIAFMVFDGFFFFFFSPLSLSDSSYRNTFHLPDSLEQDFTEETSVFELGVASLSVY